MKITCERSYLANALGVSSRAVSSRNTLPILSNVLLETEEDRLRLTATDLDTAIRCQIPATVLEAGAVAVPAGVLGDVVSKLSDAPVTLELGDGKVSVRSGKSEYTILSLPAEDFPVVPEVSEGTELQLPQSTLKEMLRMTTFAASREETALASHGRFVRGARQCPHAGCDRHSPDWRGRRPTLGQELESPSCGVSRQAAWPNWSACSKTPPKRRSPCVLALRRSASETADVTLVSRVLDGQFPNYEKVVPKSAERKLTFDRGERLNALRRV
jgi:DNA polymerase-3 subunit beta